MSMVSSLLLFLSCDPLAKSVRDEAVWYDAERIASEAGVSLVPISSGEPVGYWTRVVIREDGIDLDNRAWALTLPEAAYAREVVPMPLVWSDLVPLEGGRIVGATEGLLIESLYEAFVEVVNTHILMGQQLAEIPFDGRLVVVPEPGIPWETIRSVIYTAASAQFSAYAIVGEVDGRLRYPSAPSAEQACPYSVNTHLTPSAAWIDAELFGAPAPPLTGAGGCADPDGIASAVAALSAACVPRWHAALAALGAEPSAGRDCVSVTVSPDSEVTAAALLQHQASLYAVWPAVEQGLLGSGSMEGSSDLAACEYAVSVASLRPDQLDYICDAERVARSLLETQHVPTWRVRRMVSIESRDYDLGALTGAFPDYVAWRGDTLPPPAREPFSEGTVYDLESTLLKGERP